VPVNPTFRCNRSKARLQPLVELDLLVRQVLELCLELLGVDRSALGESSDGRGKEDEEGTTDEACEVTRVSSCAAPRDETWASAPRLVMVFKRLPFGPLKAPRRSSMVMMSGGRMRVGLRTGQHSRSWPLIGRSLTCW
jgi:hypothetical protein